MPAGGRVAAVWPPLPADYAVRSRDVSLRAAVLPPLGLASASCLGLRASHAPAPPRAPSRGCPSTDRHALHPLTPCRQGPERYRRFVEMEIKHGRLSMAAFLGVITTYSGIRFPGYLSKAEEILFTDIPGGAIASWAALPTAAWFQIVLFISICETVWLKQDPDKAPGDVVPEGVAWARYPDGYEVWLGDGSTKAVGEEELILGKTWKLNAERNNGRAAMMGITGMLIHEGLTGNPVFPIGETL